MRRRLVALGFTVVLFGVFPASAWAPHHLMLVNEVYPAATAAQQFVELKDPAGEPFPNLSYTLAVHDGGGMLMGSQTFTTSFGNPFAGTTSTILLGKSAPLDLPLALTLPLPAGQVCFYHDGPAAANRINCLGYGHVTNPLPTDSGTTGVVASLPPGSSAQRLAVGGVCAGTPTRDSENACAGGGDTTDPIVTVSRKKKQDVDKVVLSVTTNEATTVTIRASVSIPGASKTLRFKKVTRALKAGVKKKIRLRLKKSRKKAVKRAIADGAKPKARVKLTATDAAGNTTLKRTRIRLKN